MEDKILLVFIVLSFCAIICLLLVANADAERSATCKTTAMYLNYQATDIQAICK